MIVYIIMHSFLHVCLQLLTAFPGLTSGSEHTGTDSEAIKMARHKEIQRRRNEFAKR